MCYLRSIFIGERLESRGDSDPNRHPEPRNHAFAAQNPRW
jgi:hypothetical protein